MKITMNRELARVIAQDAANRRMRKAGRKAWSKGDYNLCVKTFNKLWPVSFDECGFNNPF